LPLEELVRACLAKSPDDRWQSVADVRRQLTWIGSQPSGSGSGITPVQTPRSRLAASIWPLATVVLAAGLVLSLPAALRQWRTPAVRSDVTRFPVAPPPDTTFATSIAQVSATQFALSPDGRRLAFVAAAPGGSPALWLRTLDSTEPILLGGTDDASYPFWSPDGGSLGFFAHNALKRLDIGGGSPRMLCEAGFEARGGAWNADGVIVFAGSTRSGLLRVPADGGVPSPLLNLREGESSYRWPSFLPDGRRFLFQMRRSSGRGIYVGSLDGASPSLLLDDAPYAAVYAPPGFLLTMRDGMLLAYPFDVDRLQLTGEPIRLADAVGGSTTARASFAASMAGVLAYAGPVVTPSRLEWFDRSGNVIGRAGDVGDYVNFRISPDGRQVALTRVDEKTNTTDIWLLDVSRNIRTKFTSDPGTDTSPVWSRDGTRIAFRSDRAGGNFPFERPSAANAPEQQLASTDTTFLTDWAPDGRLVFHSAGLGSNSYDVGLMAATRAAKANVAVQTQNTDIDGRVSPDGQWIAYSSNDSGRMEVYAAPFANPGGGRQVSSDGGSEPHWRGDGRELFYLGPDRSIMSVAVGRGATLDLGSPQRLFATKALFPGSSYRMNYDVAADGSRFLVSTPVEGAGTSPITVVLNWPAALKR
jgi:Tol biopolymer transport system component